ncbi:13486_t:CDS:1, partial [Rhizophagus irregularis]
KTATKGQKSRQKEKKIIGGKADTERGSKVEKISSKNEGEN